MDILKVKGIDKLREKLPAYPGKKIALLPLRGLLGSVIAYVFIIILSITPRVLSEITLLSVFEPYLPLLGGILVAIVGLRLVWSLWNQRDEMKELHGDLAYQKMIRRGVVGIFLVVTLVFQAFTSFRSLPPGPPVNDLTIQWSRSLLPLFGIAPEVDLWFRMIVSGILIILAALTVRSAVNTFGMDYMTVVYLYFPEESEVQQHEIYSVIRHPAYLAGVILGIAGLFFRFSVYSILMCLLVYVVFRLQIWREERELIERFGEGYIEYRKEVPALFIRPSKIKSYLKFLRQAP
ncbi:MAG: methyltransferase family protein [Candidatus Thorarchaeota archaeon]|jgi:protein-S-isoprenylcysteine O-methyltransferase Ste14